MIKMLFCAEVFVCVLLSAASAVVLSHNHASPSPAASPSHAAYKNNVVFSIRPGEKTCFSKNVEVNNVIEIVYKVVWWSGERAVSVSVAGPRGAGLRARRWQAGAHALSAAAAGPYRVCFDNSHDRVGTKTIFFDINIHPNLKRPKLIQKNAFFETDFEKDYLPLEEFTSEARAANMVESKLQRVDLDAADAGGATAGDARLQRVDMDGVAAGRAEADLDAEDAAAAPAQREAGLLRRTRPDEDIVVFPYYLHVL